MRSRDSNIWPDARYSMSVVWRLDTSDSDCGLWNKQRATLSGRVCLYLTWGRPWLWRSSPERCSCSAYAVSRAWGCECPRDVRCTEARLYASSSSWSSSSHIEESARHYDVSVVRQSGLVLSRPAYNGRTSPSCIPPCHLHTNNNVEATCNFVACCFDTVVGVDGVLRLWTPNTYLHKLSVRLIYCMQLKQNKWWKKNKKPTTILDAFRIDRVLCPWRRSWGIRDVVGRICEIVLSSIIHCIFTFIGYVSLFVFVYRACLGL